MEARTPPTIRRLNPSRRHQLLAIARVWRAYSETFRASALNAAGRHADALDVIERGLALWEATGTRLYLPLVLGLQLDSFIALGRLDAAEPVLQAFYRHIEASAERWNESDIRRIEGDLRLAQGAAGRAERCYRQALDVAGAQQARSFELRAATALARLWAEQSERRKAEDLLAPLYAWFTQGLETPDLRDANDLLHGLG